MDFGVETETVPGIETTEMDFGALVFSMSTDF